jgi:hypothetical protein
VIKNDDCCSPASFASTRADHPTNDEEASNHRVSTITADAAPSMDTAME